MNKVRNNKAAITLFIIPTLVLFLMIIIVPIFMDVYYSFFKWNGITEPDFIGLSNYIDLLTKKIFVLTKGGPAHASEVPSTLMVNMIFGRNKYGYGSAIAVFIIFLCFFFAIMIKKVFRTEVN